MYNPITKVMETNFIKSKLFDVLQSSEFINIDQNDITRFFDGVSQIDMVISSGNSCDIRTLILDSINSIQDRNINKCISKILFIIRLPKGNNFLIENVEGVYEIIEFIDNEVEITWGISTWDYLQEQQVELIFIVGF